ncbi:o-succinylbenzoate synthase [Pseudoclavibacter chungangensis]|uniref:o-succinylbenzoate synthase n=1 Tax=Pseudoclavibacter chungangensis TaxID=587635 RepID=A0A7J5BT92_9MICO|nr:o-succinylbenzoate synthase [Pseudoclavibacter chungangensis]KAB1656767.1 o-succinylbenzoate synthase [Pseudoclavibacter chungangensis]
MPPIEDLLERVHVVSLPLNTRFRGVEHREVALVDGRAGWAEFSPFTEYGDEEAATWLAAAIEAAELPSPVPTTGTVRVNATVPAVDRDEVPAVLARYDGCRTVKVKVAERGQSLADDVARVGAVRDVLGPDARLRVDANGGWSLTDAERAIDALAPFGLEYAEQPVATLDDLAALRRRLQRSGTPVRIAADESVRKAADPLAVVRAEAADLLVVKAQPLGGVRRAAELVREAGLPATVSSALDSSVGIVQGARLAALIAPDTERAGAPRGGFDAGLGTVSLFAAEVVPRPLVPRAGSIALRAVAPDPELLARHAVPRERDTWWRERIRRCHAVLTGRDRPA